MTIGKLLASIEILRKEGKKACTLLCIGPMSKPVLRAAFELGNEKDFPVILIASRNQVDDDEFGGGYVRGWNQRQFVDEIKKIVDETGFGGLYYICRDHGGPWQRDKERSDKLPEDMAMEIGRKSYLADLIAGFDLLHIDPTKDPHYAGTVPMETILSRTVELIKYIETERRARNLPPIDYEVGTEETNGGLTTPGAYIEFIEKLKKMLHDENLPMPVFIVGQTGTLVRLTENVGRFDIDTAAFLSDSARCSRLGLKEHNADYLSNEALLAHMIIGVAAANVAPEFGVAETEAYLMLSGIEKIAFERGLVTGVSCFADTIRRAAVSCQRWRKWMTGDVPLMSIEEIEKDNALMDVITHSSGHYTFEDAEVSKELSVMKANLRSLGLDPDSLVLDRIKRSISRYVDCFGISGLTSLVRKIENE